jgi:hypothetical protein
MSSVTIQNGSISVLNLSGVVKNNNLSKESNSFSRGILFGVSSNISSFDFFNGNIFDIETDVIPWDSFS